MTERKPSRDELRRFWRGLIVIPPPAPRAPYKPAPQRTGLAELCRKTGIEYSIAYQRMRNGWSMQRAVSEPVNKKRLRGTL